MDSLLEAAAEEVAEDVDADVDVDAVLTVESLGCCEDELEVSGDAEALGKDDKLAEAVDNVDSVSAVVVNDTALNVISDDDNEDDDVDTDEDSVAG